MELKKSRVGIRIESPSYDSVPGNVLVLAGCAVITLALQIALFVCDVMHIKLF